MKRAVAIIMQHIRCAWPCLLFVSPAQGAVVACGGDNQWPPSSYRMAAAADVQGYSPDVLHAVLGGKSAVQVRLMPFARCLALAEQGRQVQIVMAASRSPERERHFLFTRSYLQLHPVSLTLQFAQVGAKPLPWCGLNGFNYQAFGVSADAVDRGSSTYPDMLRKLRAGRCRGFVEFREVWQGLLKQGVLRPEELPPLKIQPLPGRSPVSLAFMVSKQYADAQGLRRRLDRGLQALQMRGGQRMLLERQLH